MEMIRKVFNSVIKDIDEAKKELTALVSTGGVDRMGDVLEPKGVDLKHYKKNPVVMWAHDYETPPIAKALWTKKTDQGVISKMKFANTEFANEIFELYKEGFMSAFSVGFIPKESEPMDKDDDSHWGAKRFMKWELLEYSAVPIPANPEALALAVSKGIITDDKKHILDEMEDLRKTAEDEEGHSRKKDGDSDDEEGDDQDDQDEEDDEDDDDIKTIPKEDPIEIKQPVGLGDLIGEVKLLEEKIDALEKENSSLRYKLYQVRVWIEETKKHEKPEITVDNLADKFREVVDGVIRQAQGKVN